MLGQVVIHSSVRVNGSLPKVMRLASQTTTETARKAGYSQPMISKLSSGAAKLPYENVRTLLDSIPEKYRPRLALEIAHELVGITPPNADGIAFSDNSLQWASYLQDETNEGLKALGEAKDELRSPRTAKSNRDPIAAVNQLLDAQFVIENALIKFCEDFDLSLVLLEKEREKVWKMAHYIN
ncbi:hypothetical protein [Lactiplantibacillus mudanjiangensis]|uniref:Prophage protein 14 [Lactobacillus plantarum] n=1 Tax=Lactiplantibacillus mudanjiangensis TaxID=1296538 RepID=A0A660DWW9_9LACO|nr:hypothetical protein [Lactiplantibacillus mudanjiangensis]VDG23702.1 prophage protein 14 [Lactobacillus plantarum] [Lactiplantibacillus mudanjiangensis]VDG27846.1 prophage protein 14 [Lactobacillus plantarum] [Lactiplantibacillus mudanjiangensis]